MADEQGVPELVVDTSAGTFFGDNTGLDGLFEQIKDGVFVGIGVDAYLHLLDDVEGEGAAQHGSVAKESLTGRGQAAHAQFKNGGDGVRQGKLGIDYVAGLIGRYRSSAVRVCYMRGGGCDLRLDSARKLFREEGVTRCPGLDVLHHRPWQVGQQRGYLLVGKRLNGDTQYDLLALQVSEERTQGITGR